MAEADAKLTGVPAVAMATRGVGASNLAIGVHTRCRTPRRWSSCSGTSRRISWARAFQEVDLAASTLRSPSGPPRSTRRPPGGVRREGLRIATSGRPGPVMLALPADILAEEVPAPPSTDAPPPPRPAPIRRSPLHLRLLNRLVAP